MRIFAVVQRCHSTWLAFTAIVNLPIGRLDASDVTFILDDAFEHIGLGVVVDFC